MSVFSDDEYNKCQDFTGLNISFYSIWENKCKHVFCNKSNGDVLQLIKLYNADVTEIVLKVIRFMGKLNGKICDI